MDILNAGLGVALVASLGGAWITKHDLNQTEEQLITLREDLKTCREEKVLCEANNVTCKASLATVNQIIEDMRVDAENFVPATVENTVYRYLPAETNTTRGDCGDVEDVANFIRNNIIN